MPTDPAVVAERKRIADWFRRRADMHWGITRLPFGVADKEGDGRHYATIEDVAAMLESGNLPEEEDDPKCPPGCEECGA